MTLLFVLLFLFFLIASVVAFISHNTEDKQRARKNEHIFVPYASIGWFLACLFSLFLAISVKQVGAAQVMVVFNSSTGDLRGPLGSGMYLTLPFIDAPTTYDVSNKNVEQRQADGNGLDARTSDGQTVTLDLNLIYSLDSSQILPIHLKWAGLIEANLIIPTLRSIGRDVMSGYTATEINGGGRVEYAQKVKAALTEKVASDGVIINDVLVRQITFSDEFNSALEQVQLAELSKKAAIENAAKTVTDAQAQADAVRAKAKGDADATVTKAEADAKALSLVAAQIKDNPSLLMYRYIESLGDNVVAIVPSGSPFIFDANQLMNGFKSTPEVTPTPTPVAP